MEWKQAISVEQLRTQKKSVFRSGTGHQITLFWVKGKAFAIDNRCPHEGYPLREGTVNEETCILTCQWHNWKFQLSDGKAILGGDAVRTYPTKIQDSLVWVDLSEPSPEQRTQQILDGLKNGFQRMRFGQTARELTRLQVHGLDPLDAIRAAIHWSHDHLEYGTEHSYAVTADWLSIVRETGRTEEEQIIGYTESIDHIAWDCLRHPAYPFPEDGLPFDGQALLDAIEAEDSTRALRIVRGGLDEGYNWNQWEFWLAQAAFAHFNDFGHSVIYVYKMRTLVEHLGDPIIPYLVLPLVRSLCYTTREDLLPDFKMYTPTLQDAPTSFGSSKETLSFEELETLSITGALKWVNQHISTSTPHTLYSVLMASAARHLLMYDMKHQYAFDNKVKDNVGWLHLTHALTFGNAVRVLCETHPQLWTQGLLQMACFSGRNVPYIDPSMNVEPWLLSDVETYFENSLQEVMDHGIGIPIFAAHKVKTWYAVREELPYLAEEHKTWIVAALHRFLDSPIKQKHIRRLVRQGQKLVRQSAV